MISEDFSLQSFQFAFGNACDRPGYVAESVGPPGLQAIPNYYAITLARIRWDFFATLTFAGTVPRENIAYGLAFRWLRGVAEYCDVKPYKRLISALRGEFGEMGGRFHFHCLVGGTNTRNYITARHALEHQWKVIASGGRVEVRQYDRTLAGAEYVSKCLGANDYEAKKYAFADSVTLSHSVYRIVAGLDATMERHCCQQHAIKRDGAELQGVSMQSLPCGDQGDGSGGLDVVRPALR